jgi:hypothetical protein
MYHIPRLVCINTTNKVAVLVDFLDQKNFKKYQRNNGFFIWSKRRLFNALIEK